MNESNTIELTGVGPINHLSIPIPEGGGLVVLKGPNGSGKSHAIQAVDALASKDSRSGLQKNDKVRAGSVEGLGVTVRLGRVNTAKGDLVCESLDGRVDPSLLVDPGIKDPDKADAKRLATLIRLAGVKVSAAEWAAAVQSDEFADLVDDDPVVSADRIRRKLHAIALDKEKRAASKQSESIVLLKSVEDVDTSGDWDSATLSDALDKATTDLAKAEQARLHYEDQKSKRDAAEAKIEKLEIVDISKLQSDFEACESKQRLIVEKVDGLIRQQQEIEKQLADANAELERCDSEINHLHQRFSDAKERNRERDELAELIKGSLPDSIDDSTIVDLIEAKSQARKKLERAEVVRRAVTTRHTAGALAAEAELIAKSATKNRDLARSTDAVLEQGLINAGFDLIKVDDGRLCVETDRGLEPFSELSHGERWRIALDLAAAGLPAGSVLPVCQEAFESLDPSNRIEVANMARERGLVIVTALADGGELRAEVLEGGVA